MAKAYTVEALEAEHAAAIERNSGPTYPKKSTINMYVGGRGMGKSVAAVADAAMAYKAGISVIHNGAMFFGEELDLDRMMDNGYSQCLIVLDELEEYLNNLRTSSTVQVDLISMLIQMRHQDVEILATTQHAKEINGRFKTRTDLRYLCISRDEGRSVWQAITPAPWDEDNKNFGKPQRKRVLKNAWRFWNFYDTKRFVAVGANRASASELRARDQLRATKQIWGYVVARALDNADAVGATEIQYALDAQQPPLNLTSQKISRVLGDFVMYGLSLSKFQRNGRNVWAIPAGLAEAYTAENPEAAAELMADPELQAAG